MIGLKNEGKQRNLNQQKAAMDLNISREALSYYENGKRESSLALLAMFGYFNISTNTSLWAKNFKKDESTFRLRKCRFIFALLRYNLRSFTDTNIVICKIIVGTKASLV